VAQGVGPEFNPEYYKKKKKEKKKGRNVDYLLVECPSEGHRK
jgi:hypothetical protein